MTHTTDERLRAKAPEMAALLRFVATLRIPGPGITKAAALAESAEAAAAARALLDEIDDGKDIATR